MSLSDLNERIFAAMDELDAADDEHLDQAIQKARTKTQLFAMAINNANTMVKIARMQEQAMGGLAIYVGTSRRLLGEPGQEPVEAAPPSPAGASPFDAVAWVRVNGTGHSASWIRDRLNKASGEDYTFEEVEAICDEARVEPVDLGKKHDMRQAEAVHYAQRARASDRTAR